MKKKRNEAWVGMFVIVGFIILTLMTFFVSGAYLFRKGYTLNVMYKYVSILDRGAPVRMAGVRVGEVNGVELIYDAKAGQTKVLVKLFIEKGVEIRQNYAFHIRGTHVLSEPHIEISPRPGNAPVIERDSTIRGEDPVPLEALIQRAHDISKNIDAIFKTFRDAVDDRETGETFRDMLANLAKMSKSMSEVLDGSEEDLKRSIANLDESSEALSVTLERVRRGEGTAGKLLMEDELYQEIRAFVAEIKAHPWRLLRKDNERRKFLGIF
jgi:phospholipid/cholesterol/gamma-HCH transport system substrate-binding protein